MLQATRTSSAALGRTAVLTLIAAAVLSACGGGGGDPGAVPAASGNTGTGTGTGTGNTGNTGGGTVTTPTATETKVTLALVDGSGNNVTSLSGGQSGTLKATVLTPAGKPAVGAIVQFATAASGMVVFTPDTGSALTDANGVAVVTVKPASYTTSGALALSATAVVEGKTGISGLNIAIGAAPLTVGALSFAEPPSNPLPAFSTVALNIPISSGGQPAAVSTGLVLTSDCVAAGSATLVAGPMNNGVQVATYTNNGCVLVTDRITASIGNSSQPITLAVGTANIGSIQFAGGGLATQSIVLKGSGGLGRSESAQLSFRVVDQQGSALPGVNVAFGLTTAIGGLAVSPANATTDASGNVSVTVSSGTIPTPVRVLATAVRNGRTISGQSDTLLVSTGLPIQKSMSISAEYYNIEGGDINGTEVGITARMADQYGNKVSDGAAVTFVTEGGAIGTSGQGGCTTVEGQCSVKLVSQAFRPTDGRVTVLALAQGVEDFNDLNGDGQYTCPGKPDTYRPLAEACDNPGQVEFDVARQDMGDPFLDVVRDGKPYNPAEGDKPFPFKGTTYRATGDGAWGANFLRSSIEIVFSGSYARMTDVCNNGVCTNTVYNPGATLSVAGAAGANCAPRQMSVRLMDERNNPLPYNTAVSIVSANKLSVVAVSPATIASTIDSGGTVHLFTVTPDAACTAGDFTLQTKTPQGKITEFKFIAN
jgi:hypothetical protein